MRLLASVPPVQLRRGKGFEEKRVGYALAHGRVRKFREARKLASPSLAHGGGTAEVRWRFADGSLLQAVLALSAKGTANIAIARSGRPLFVTDSAASKPDTITDLPPWFAGWFLATPGTAA